MTHLGTLKVLIYSNIFLIFVRTDEDQNYIAVNDEDLKYIAVN